MIPEKSDFSPPRWRSISCMASATAGGGEASRAPGKRMASLARRRDSFASGSAEPITLSPRQTIAQRPIGVSKSAKPAPSSGSLFVVAAHIVVARRRRGGEAQRLGRRAQRADFVRSLVVVDLDALEVRDQGFLE